MVCMHDPREEFIMVLKVDIIYSPSRGWYGVKRDAYSIKP